MHIARAEKKAWQEIYEPDLNLEFLFPDAGSMNPIFEETYHEGSKHGSALKQPAKTNFSKQYKMKLLVNTLGKVKQTSGRNKHARIKKGLQEFFSSLGSISPIEGPNSPSLSENEATQTLVLIQETEHKDYSPAASGLTTNDFEEDAKQDKNDKQLQRLEGNSSEPSSSRLNEVTPPNKIGESESLLFENPDWRNNSLDNGEEMKTTVQSYVANTKDTRLCQSKNDAACNFRQPAKSRHHFMTDEDLYELELANACKKKRSWPTAGTTHIQASTLSMQQSTSIKSGMLQSDPSFIHYTKVNRERRSKQVDLSKARRTKQGTSVDAVQLTAVIDAAQLTADEILHDGAATIRRIPDEQRRATHDAVAKEGCGMDGSETNRIEGTCMYEGYEGEGKRVTLGTKGKGPLVALAASSKIKKQDSDYFSEKDSSHNFQNMWDEALRNNRRIKKDRRDNNEDNSLEGLFQIPNDADSPHQTNHDYDKSPVQPQSKKAPGCDDPKELDSISLHSYDFMDKTRKYVEAGEPEFILGEAANSHPRSAVSMENETLSPVKPT